MNERRQALKGEEGWKRAGRGATVVAIGLLVLQGCGFWRPNVIPMAQVFDRASCSPRDGEALPLLVLLPGRFMQPAEFIREGYLQAVRERGLAVDVVIVDAHLGYYSDRSVLERLRADIVEPARQRGVKHIWLAGISIGAFGALLYADAHPGELAGLIAIGPFLGSTSTAGAITRAGGLPRWRAPSTLAPLSVASSDTDAQLHVWRWLQEQTSDSRRLDQVPLYLGVGRQDRYREAHQLLADVLPPTHVVVVEGDHDWSAWRPAWWQLLDILPIDRRSDCKPGNAARPTT